MNAKLSEYQRLEKLSQPEINRKYEFLHLSVLESHASSSNLHSQVTIFMNIYIAL